MDPGVDFYSVKCGAFDPLKLFLNLVACMLWAKINLKFLMALQAPRKFSQTLWGEHLPRDQIVWKQVVEDTAQGFPVE